LFFFAKKKKRVMIGVVIRRERVNEKEREKIYIYKHNIIKIV